MGSKRKRAAKDTPLLHNNDSKRARKNGSSSTATQPLLSKELFVESPLGEERKRESTLYDLLGSEDESERIQAADCIICSLLGGSGVSEAVLERHLNRRLFRGLASGRNASRIGFSLVITEVLQQLYGAKDLSSSTYRGLTFDKVLGYLIDKTQVVGNVPGQEERDHYFGKLFGLECFVKSGVLFTETSRWRAVLELLLAMGDKKVWLRSQCGWILVQALGLMELTEVEKTLQKLTETGMAKTPEGIAAWLVALKRSPKLKVRPWIHPLSSKALGDLTMVLKESFRTAEQSEVENSQAKAKQSNSMSQLHFVWDLILATFVEGNAPESDGLDKFWARVVDDGLFSKNATDGQKFKGFMVFQKFLEGLAGKGGKVKCLFTKHLMACLMNQAAKSDRFVHRAAIKALKSIEMCTSQHPEILPDVLWSLLGERGAYAFDQRTNTKTVDKLIQNINEQNGDEVLKVVRRPMETLSQIPKGEAQSILRVFVDYLSKIAATPRTNSSSNTKHASAAALRELSLLAYSKPNYVPADALTAHTREMCRSRLEASLAKLTRQTDDYDAFCDAVESLETNVSTTDEDISKALEDALKRMRKLRQRKSKHGQATRLLQALSILHAVAIFQLYNEDPDAMEVLADLAQYSETLPKKNQEEGEGSSEILVEILLSMVARPSALMRQVSQQVFSTFTGSLSAESLALLTDPLSSDESTKGRQQLFSTEDEDIDADQQGDSDDDAASDDDADVVDVEDASDVEIGSDVEFVGLNGDDDGGSEASDSSEDEESQKSDGDEGKQEPQDLDELAGQILKSHRLDKDNDAPSSDSDGDMSDSEMLALDDKLAEVFKHRVQARPDSKKDKKEAKQSVVNFKHRILDLLDIFVKNEPAHNPLTLQTLVPLLQLIRTTTTKALGSRACEIILNYQRGMKKARNSRKQAGADGDGDREEEEEAEGRKSSEEGAATENLLGLLMQIHEEAGRDKSHAYAKAASAASLIVASTMYAADRELVKQAAAAYAKTQSDCVLGLTQVQNSFFTDWNNWCQAQASVAQREKSG